MNKNRSDKFIKKRSQKRNTLNRTSFTCQKTLKTTPSALFKLLCPSTEYDWIPQWSCELLHSNSGYGEYNAIFKTNAFGPEEIFVCTRYEPDKAIEYSRTTQDICIKLDIFLTENSNGTVTSQWSVHLSALNENGNCEVSRLADIQDDLPEVFNALEHYVEKGEIMC